MNLWPHLSLGFRGQGQSAPFVLLSALLKSVSNYRILAYLMLHNNSLSICWEIQKLVKHWKCKAAFVHILYLLASVTQNKKGMKYTFTLAFSLKIIYTFTVWAYQIKPGFWWNKTSMYFPPPPKKKLLQCKKRLKFENCT